MHHMARNKLPRKSVSFSEPQDAWLEAEAKRLGLPESEIVRYAVDVARGARPAGQPLQPKKPAAGSGKATPA